MRPLPCLEAYGPPYLDLVIWAFHCWIAEDTSLPVARNLSLGFSARQRSRKTAEIVAAAPGPFPPAL